MSLLSDFELSNNPDFRAKIKAALCLVAVAVANDTNHPKYDERVRIAREIVRNPEDWAARLAPVFATSSQIDANSNDVQIVNVITQMWATLPI